MKHKKLAALMGRRVLVTAILSRVLENLGINEEEQTDNGITAEWVAATITARVGWVVGLRHLQTGYSARPSWDEYNTGEPMMGDWRDWHETAPRAPCLLVCFWPSEKAVRVPLDGYEVGQHVDILEPHRSGLHQYDIDDLREEMTARMKLWPRDIRGRWLPAGKKGADGQ